MKILDDLISQLNMDAAVQDIRQGVFHTAVVTRYCGLAATLPKDALRQKPPLVKEPGNLMEKSAQDLTRLAYSDSILEAAVGMAAINSLIEVDADACRELNAAELIMEKGEGKQVAIVGHFPFIPKVREVAAQLWVIEKNPRGDDLEEDAAESVIPRADVVAITGTALTNHTLDRLLGLCSPAAFVVLLGDTAPLSPVLFDYGVGAVSGTWVVDPDLALRCVSQGANFRQIRGTRRLTLMR
ncbi:MAG: DUF364 domain-containing protein [Candidatus Desulfacyla sp.]